jgi:hypothetical protein
MFFNRDSFFPEQTIMKSIIVDVTVAIVSIGMTLSSARPILNAVGIVDQNNTANPA